MFEVVGVGGLNEAEMALGQRDSRVAGQGAQHGQPDRLDRRRRQPSVPFAADLVQDHPRDLDARIEQRASLGDGGCRLRLPRDVDHQDDRQPQEGGEVGRGASAAAGPGAPSNRPIEPSAIRMSASAAVAAARPAIRASSIAQVSRFTLGRPRGRLMEGVVDIVRPGFRRGDAYAPVAEGAHEAEGTVVLPLPERGAAR